jgi:hypothetical protein
MTQTPIIIKDPQSPASEKQIAFLTSLVKDRECPSVAEKFRFAQAVGFLAKGAASGLIDEALKAPKKGATATVAAPAAAPEAPKPALTMPAFGYYEINGTVYYWDVTGKDAYPTLRKLTKVTQYGGTVKGKWSKLSTYGSNSAGQVEATWTPFAGKGYNKTPKTMKINVPLLMATAVAQGVQPMSLEQAAKQGHMLGFCIRCGATLTDPESVAAGIGPVCKNYWF